MSGNSSLGAPEQDNLFHQLTQRAGWLELGHSTEEHPGRRVSSLELEKARVTYWRAMYHMEVLSRAGKEGTRDYVALQASAFFAARFLGQGGELP